MKGKRNTGESFVREFKTSQRAEALWKYCMLSFLFFFHILRCLSQWEVIFCHKLWEEVNVRPPPAQVLCPNHPVTGKLFGKTGLVGQRVVGEHGVVPWRAGAVGVLTGGGVLLEGHRQVQVLLSGERSKVRLWCHRQTISLLVVRWLEQEHCVHCFLNPLIPPSVTCNCKMHPNIQRLCFHGYVRLKKPKSYMASSLVFISDASVLSVNGSCAGRLTSVEVIDKIRSWSSTSCLKVGLCDGTACQHSLMIMYLKSQHQGFSQNIHTS